MNKRLSWSGLTRAQLVQIASTVFCIALPARLWAAPPSQPGTPFESSSSDGSTTIAWVASGDDVGVAGYNVYQDNRYLATVPNADYTFLVDRSIPHTYYVVAFDVAGPGESRGFSPRSVESRKPPQ